MFTKCATWAILGAYKIDSTYGENYGKQFRNKTDQSTARER